MARQYLGYIGTSTFPEEPFNIEAVEKIHNNLTGEYESPEELGEELKKQEVVGQEKSLLDIALIGTPENGYSLAKGTKRSNIWFTIATVEFLEQKAQA